jgi:hypothetical protein
MLRDTVKQLGLAECEPLIGVPDVGVAEKNPVSRRREFAFLVSHASLPLA